MATLIFPGLHAEHGEAGGGQTNEERNYEIPRLLHSFDVVSFGQVTSVLRELPVREHSFECKGQSPIHDELPK